ncbi:MAG: RNA methyltransferase [bacterium]
MLTKAQEKLIRSLHRGKERNETGLCLVEGGKSIAAAGDSVEFTFTRDDTPEFDRLLSTETPQNMAAVARIPNWSQNDLSALSTLVVLDGVQDPGNVGAILRLCLGFDAGLLLIESADVSSPKAVRSSAGAMFSVPWLRLSPDEATDHLRSSGRRLFRLEKRPGGTGPESLTEPQPIAVIAGSEGQGIRLDIEGQGIEIPHDARLESLNVTHALAIGLYLRHRERQDR